MLGWDAVGQVVEVGDGVVGFKPGDDVFYAGSIARPGSNSEFHLVDERIVGRKPKSLSDAEAAALPLTALTAWEMLFDRIDVAKPVPGAANAILIVGGLAASARSPSSSSVPSPISPSSQPHRGPRPRPGSANSELTT